MSPQSDSRRIRVLDAERVPMFQLLIGPRVGETPQITRSSPQISLPSVETNKNR